MNSAQVNAGNTAEYVPIVNPNFYPYQPSESGATFVQNLGSFNVLDFILFFDAF